MQLSLLCLRGDEGAGLLGSAPRQAQLCSQEAEEQGEKSGFNRWLNMTLSKSL